MKVLKMESCSTEVTGRPGQFLPVNLAVAVHARAKEESKPVIFILEVDYESIDVLV